MSSYVVHTSETPGCVPCRVIAKLQPRTWRVIVGIGIGHMDGGQEMDLDEDDLPVAVRRPNAEFYLGLQR
jgi:hypothetical protein